MVHRILLLVGLDIPMPKGLRSLQKLQKVK